MSTRTVVLLMIMGFGLPAAAQGTGSTATDAAAQSQPQQPQAQAPQPHNDEKQIQKQEQSQRILGVMPMFSVTSRQNAPPLTPSEKFHLMLKQVTDPFTFGSAAVQAGIGQATNEFPGYGQGAEGYAKRYGATYADQASSQFFSNFFYSVLFKEDPRYFRSGEGTIKHRIGHALTQEFVCHKNAGGRSFSWENVLGAFTAGGLSNVYYPSTDRGFGLTISRSTIALAYGSAGGLLQEFWPDIHNKLFHRKPQPGQGPPR